MNTERVRNAPISGKLRFTILFTCTVALLCASVALFAIHLHFFRRDFFRQIQTVSETAADGAGVAISNNEPGAAHSILELLMAEPHIVSAAVVLNDGRVFAEAGEAVGARSFFEQPIAAEGGVLRICTDFAAQTIRLAGFHALVFAAVLAVAFLVAVPVSSRLFRLISDPIKTLGDTAREVAARDDYSLRVKKTGEDEVGAFTDTFNSMLTQIQSRDAALRHEIAERARAEEEVARIHRQLMEASRQAGMAEVATGLLHNVGNVLNSVNVSATVVAEKLDPAGAADLIRAANLLREHDGALADFLANDPKGRLLPRYFAEIGAQLAEERAAARAELESLTKHIEHMKEIVATQQSHARVTGIVEPLPLAALIEDALRMNASGLEASGIVVERDFGSVPPAMVDRHKLLQILVNLILNAKDAIDDASTNERRLSIAIRSKDGRYVEAIFSDTGAGIPGENLTRIFSHGFTTREHGHGFGLHSAALAAQEMAGRLSAHSAGPGKGATFTLELPLADAPATSA